MTGGVEAPNAAGYTGGLVPVSILRLRSVSLAGGLFARQHTAAAKRQPSLVDAVEEPAATSPRVGPRRRRSRASASP